jgi:uncharacterized membrane protein SpoIIM required for sporulation
MREGKFLKQNMDRWESYDVPTSDPDEQAERLVNLIDDLGYAKTFYPNSTTTQYVNGLAGKQFSDIYLKARRKRSRFKQFFVYELPYIFSKHHNLYLFTFLFFASSIAIAAVASQTDPAFITSILGEDYVSTTIENIRLGTPFAIYAQEPPFVMFVKIAMNNVNVSFLAYIGGVAFGLPTLYLLFTNGIMVGAFHSMCFKYGVGWDSFMVVWLHGTLEINAIVIAGFAGLMLGFGFLFPGTYTRLHSLKNHARDSIKVIVAMVPFFVGAAIIESYLTRHAYAHIHVAITLSIVALSWIFVIGYFMIWPRILRKRGVTFDLDGQMYVHGKKEDLNKW